MQDMLSNVKGELEDIVQYLLKDIGSLRAGRATPALVENIKVKAYENVSELKHVASISTPDPKTIFIQPWDKALLDPIQHALKEANLGMLPAVQEGRILLILPSLTSERREEFMKVLGKKIEDARVKVRQKRDKAKNLIQTAERNKEISEDEKFRLHKELQKIIDEYSDAINNIESQKMREIEG